MYIYIYVYRYTTTYITIYMNIYIYIYIYSYICAHTCLSLYTRYTNYLFNGHEACDCFEFGGWAGPVDVNNATENRIYLNGDADQTVT